MVVLDQQTAAAGVLPVVETARGVRMSDLPPIRFRDAGTAYRWAEEAASLTDVQSPTWMVIRSMQQVAGKGFGEWDRSDYRDLALTILSEIAQIPDATARTAFQHVWGLAYDERHDDLATRIAKLVMIQHQALTYSPVKRVTMIAVMRARSRITGRKPLPFAYYGRALGMDRRAAYRSPWREVIEQAEGIMAEWVRRAEVDLVEKLRRIGVL